MVQAQKLFEEISASIHRLREERDRLKLELESEKGGGAEVERLQAENRELQGKVAELTKALESMKKEGAETLARLADLQALARENGPAPERKAVPAPKTAPVVEAPRPAPVAKEPSPVSHVVEAVSRPVEVPAPAPVVEDAPAEAAPVAKEEPLPSERFAEEDLEDPFAREEEDSQLDDDEFFKRLSAKDGE